MPFPGTNEVIETFKQFYINNYKALFNSYHIELEFATILYYYSGNCAFIINANSAPNIAARTEMCLMLECTESELKDLTDSALHLFFQQRILEKYKGLLELNKYLCEKSFNRKLIIMNTNFNEAILNIKLDKDVLKIELNYEKIKKLNDIDMDFINAIEGLSQYFNTIKQ